MAERRPLVVGAGGLGELPAGDTLPAAAVVAVPATGYSLLADHNGAYLRFTAGTAKSITVRAEATHPLPGNGEWHIRNVGAGTLTLTPASGVSIAPPYAGTLNVPPGGTVTLKRVAPNEFDLMGVTA